MFPQQSRQSPKALARSRHHCCRQRPKVYVDHSRITLPSAAVGWSSNSPVGYEPRRVCRALVDLSQVAILGSARIQNGVYGGGVGRARRNALNLRPQCFSCSPRRQIHPLKWFPGRNAGASLKRNFSWRNFPPGNSRTNRTIELDHPNACKRGKTPGTQVQQ